jgi:hypothetical protein
LDRSGVAVPDPGSGAFLSPGYEMGKNQDSGSGMNIPDYISESFETIFWLKCLNSLMRIRESGSGMEKFGSKIRDRCPGSATLDRRYIPLN